MRAVLVVLALMIMPVGLAFAESAKGVAPVCDGPEVAKARKIAARDDLKVASDPKACFGHFSIYGGSSKQMVAVAPSTQCPSGKILEVYGQSRAGPWYSFFQQPVCGSQVARGPKNQWGDWTITVDGRPYESRGEFYVPVR